MSLKAKNTSAPAQPVDCRQGSENREVALGADEKRRWLTQRNAAEYMLVLSQELITSMTGGETGNPKLLTLLVN